MLRRGNRLAISFILLLGTTATVGGCIDDPNDAKTWIKKLHDPRDQKEAVRQLVHINDKAAVPALIAFYNDPKGGNKDADVLDAIIHFHDTQSIPILIQSLDYTEQEFDHAAKAAEELGKLKELGNDQVKEAVPALLKALEKPLPVNTRADLVKQAAIRALAKIKDPSAVEPLCKTVRALPDQQDLFLNKVAAAALGELRDPRAIPCLLPAAFISRADGANIFQEVRVALVKMGNASVDPLIDLLKEKNTEVNQLAKKLEFKEGVIAYKAAWVLGDLHAKKAVPDLVARLHEPAKGDMQRSILIALGQIGEPAGIDAVLGVLKDGKAKTEYRESACQAVRAAREMRALPILLGIAKDGKAPPNLRIAAGMELGRLGGKAEYEAFAPVAKAEGYAEFAEVLERLDVAKNCGTDDACYIKALDDAKLTHQEKAAFMLGMAKDRSGALKALVAHLSTPEPVVRLALLDSMRRLADKGCSDCQQKLQELISKEEKITKVPAFTNMVNEMKVALAAMSRA